jgi:hypothetical protein
MKFDIYINGEYQSTSRSIFDIDVDAPPGSVIELYRDGVLIPFRTRAYERPGPGIYRTEIEAMSENEYVSGQWPGINE